jgi:Kef-type K+ transport system membrane component KefB
MPATQLAPTFFAAAVVILATCRLVSWAVARIGQPSVIGEMIAGVLLGPSLFGLLAPRLATAVFPTAVRPVLYVVGQIGLVAFMFHAGHEFRAHAKRRLAGTAVSVSAAGVLLPLILGIGLAYAAYGRVDVFVPKVPIAVSAAFVGVTLAITAFPMLARIITERGLSGSRHGSLALASGATDDVVAWIMLAGVLSVAAGRARPIALAIGGAIMFIGIVILVVRHLLAWSLLRRDWGHEARVLVTVAALFASAWFTDQIGLYAVFGAFAIGMAMPRGERSDAVVNTINSVPRLILLPMFFTYSGLNTRFDLFNSPRVILFGLAAVVVAVIGKFGGCWAVARLRGEPPAVAVRVGALMNARGLMQLIALNIGLQAGLIDSRMFTALVLVALVTTVMTAPVLSWLDRRDARLAARRDESDYPVASERVAEMTPVGVGPDGQGG